MPDILMKCGCRANATIENTDIPFCAIHDCGEKMFSSQEHEDLVKVFSNRKARCTYYPRGGKYGKCQEPQSSSVALPFFKYQPNCEYDDYYCGCWGWE